MLRNRSIAAVPALSKRAFWDTDFHALDFQKHAKFIITRVFERGDRRDQFKLLRYYGQQPVIATLTGARSLLPIAKERAKALFHLSDADFACSTNKQPARSLSRY